MTRTNAEELKKIAKEIRKDVLKMLALGALLGIVGILAAVAAGPVILTLLYTREYAEYSDVFLVISVAAATVYLVGLLQNALTA